MVWDSFYFRYLTKTLKVFMFINMCAAVKIYIYFFFLVVLMSFCNAKKYDGKLFCRWSKTDINITLTSYMKLLSGKGIFSLTMYNVHLYGVKIIRFKVTIKNDSLCYIISK